MTYKEKLVGLSLFIMLLFAGGIGWQAFLNSHDCDYYHSDISRLIDNQDILLLSYGLFAGHSLTKEKQKSFREIIELKEPLIKSKIDNFQKICRSGFRETQLITMFKSFEMYLTTKQSMFNENQWTGFNWIRKNVPVDPSIYDIE